MQTREQRYASDAYKRVQTMYQEQGEKKNAFVSNYGSMAHKLPILIHTSGLAQALTFVDSRGKEGSKRLLDDLTRTILGNEAEKRRLLEQARGIVTGEQEPGSRQGSGLLSYIYLSRQILAALLWYKRYAQSILNIEPGEEGEEDLIEGGSGDDRDK